VVQAAEELNAPAIVGFNGGFLMNPKRLRPERLAWYACLRLGFESTPVPAGFLLNEAGNLDQVREAIQSGFNAVMLENDGLSLGEYRLLVKELVLLARHSGVWVEAQVGTLPWGNGRARVGQITDPNIAAAFVAETGVDALAVSIGNIHVLTDGEASIDLEALRRIRSRIDIPLVIHGGTSLNRAVVQDLIALGVAKINFGTVLKQVYLEAVREALSMYCFPSDPHEYLGKGGKNDILTAGREALKKKIAELTRVCGAAGTTNHDFCAAI
jgi:fructose/tagatose bisphosphate aldolase